MTTDRRSPPRSAHRLDAELDRQRLARRLREKTIVIGWMRQYMNEPREARLAARYVRQAILDFEAEVEAMNARLRDLAWAGSSRPSQTLCEEENVLERTL